MKLINSLSHIHVDDSPKSALISGKICWPGPHGTFVYVSFVLDALQGNMQDEHQNYLSSLLFHPPSKSTGALQYKAIVYSVHV